MLARGFLLKLLFNIELIIGFMLNLIFKDLYLPETCFTICLLEIPCSIKSDFQTFNELWLPDCRYFNFLVMYVRSFRGVTLNLQDLANLFNKMFNVMLINFVHLIIQGYIGCLLCRSTYHERSLTKIHCFYAWRCNVSTVLDQSTDISFSFNL